MTADELRASILQLAIEGKLVPQLDNEPEVEQIGDAPEEVPFEIPNKWKWVLPKNLYRLISGRDLSKSDILETNDNTTNLFPYITGASQISNENILVNRWTKSCVVKSKKGDLLLTCKGTVGKTAFNDIGDIHIARQIMALRPYEGLLLNEYLKIFIDNLSKTLTREAKSMIPGIDRKTILAKVIPLPPLEEQKRIIEKLNELMPLVKQYGNSFESLKALDQEFPSQLKASLLQEAIQGKLVPQLDNEPEVEQIGDAPEEVPFEIPSKWKWVQLKSLAVKRSTIEPLTLKEKQVELWSIPAYDTGFCEICSPQKIGSSKKEVFTGDVLLAKIVPHIRRVWIVNENERKLKKLASTEWLVYESKFFDPLLLSLWLHSPYFNALIMQTISGMGSLKRANPKRVNEIWLPLPPLEEQKRIVEKLNELMKLQSSLQG